MVSTIKSPVLFSSFTENCHNDFLTSLIIPTNGSSRKIYCAFWTMHASLVHVKLTARKVFQIYIFFKTSHIQPLLTGFTIPSQLSLVVPPFIFLTVLPKHATHIVRLNVKSPGFLFDSDFLAFFRWFSINQNLSRFSRPIIAHLSF